MDGWAIRWVGSCFWNPRIPVVWTPTAVFLLNSVLPWNQPSLLVDALACHVFCVSQAIEKIKAAKSKASQGRCEF